MLLASHKLAAGEKKPRPELADVFRQHGESYRNTHRLPATHKKVVRAIEVCRTQNWEGIWIDATHAVLSARLITPAVIATALNASHWLKPSGWRSKPLSFCRWATSIWFSRCRMSSTV